MKNKFSIDSPCFCLILLLLASCTHIKDRQYLRKAENIVEADPAYALALLDSIHYMPDFNEYNRNNYKFIKLHARHLLKKNISLSPDITHIARYFEDKKEIHKAAWANFYAGKISYLRKDYENASIYLSEAKDMGTNLKDSTLLFQVYYYIGELHSIQHDRIASIEAFKEALVYSKSTSVESFLTYKIGDCYLNADLYDDAIRYYSKAEEKLISIGDSLETARLFMNISRSYIQNNDTTRSIHYINKALAFNDQPDFKYKCYLSLAFIYLKGEKIETAFHFLNKIPIHTINDPEVLNKYYLLCSEAYEKEEKYELAYWDYKKYTSLSDSLRQMQTTRRIENIIHRYDKRKLQARNLILIRQRILLVLSVIILFLFLVLIVLYVRYIIRKKENKYLKACSDLETLKKLNDENLRYENKFKEMLLRQLEISRRMALISGQPIEKNDSFLRMYEEVMGDFHKIHLNWTELYFSINYVYNNFQKKLVDKYPGLNEREIQVCCLLRAGFRTDEIAFVIHQSINTAHKHKTSIRKKLGMDERVDITEWLLKVFGDKTEDGNV